jgi:lipoprotein-releasing system ATP-binding protein
MPESLVIASAISKTFGSGAASVHAVVGATCAVNVGDRIALVGPSGSGKSTLLAMLGGLEHATSGRIAWPLLVPGERMTPRYIAFVFQQPNLLAPLTAAENVAVPLLLAGIEPAQASAAAVEVLARLDLASYSDTLPEDLSGGQAQRIGIARAIATEPYIIFADEPTGQLDSAAAAHVVDLLLDAARLSDAALVIATHDDRVASKLPMRWTMRHGRLAVS